MVPALLAVGAFPGWTGRARRIDGMKTRRANKFALYYKIINIDKANWAFPRRRSAEDNMKRSNMDADARISTLGERIKAIRMNWKWSQEAMAGALASLRRFFGSLSPF